MKISNPKLLALWPYMAQMFVGLFFVASAAWKFFEGFFIGNGSQLAIDWQFWIDQQWTLSWYAPLLKVLMPYSQWIAVFVIAAHAIAGAMLIFSYRIKIAAAILFFVQINIFLATFWGWGFLVMVGCSLWMALYYFYKNDLTAKTWRILTWLFILLCALHVVGRFNRGDPWLSSVPWQLAHYRQDVMGSSPLIKQFVLVLAETKAGPIIWAGSWWLQLLLLVLLTTKYRLEAGILWMFIAISRVLIWLDVIAAEAVVYVLISFMWVGEEAVRQISVKQKKK